MRWLVTVALLAACTEHGKGGGDVWGNTVIRFAEALCQNTCVPADQQEQCLADVLMDMDDARLQLSGVEMPCVTCMQAKTRLMPQIEANMCDSNATIDAEVLAACDFPQSDFDQDGDPANDFDEACAGFP